MIVQRLTLSICLILFSLVCSSQTLPDSSTCLNSREVKIINLAFNELDKYMKLDSNNQDLIGTKDKKITLLEWQFQLRSDQLSQANTKIAEQTKQIKRQKIQIIAYQVLIAASLLALLF
jgi:hypothetical protein